jgi:hypothetical protein
LFDLYSNLRSKEKEELTECHEKKGDWELLAFGNQGLKWNQAVPIRIHFCGRFKQPEGRTKKCAKFLGASKRVGLEQCGSVDREHLL